MVKITVSDAFCEKITALYVKRGYAPPETRVEWESMFNAYLKENLLLFLEDCLTEENK
jgi:hypothetical protein